MRIYTLTPRIVVTMPPVLEPGVLYLSLKYQTSIHLCPCGCGEKTVTPQGDRGWQRTGDESNVTLRPSILNRWCGSHYYVTANRVDWL